mmetsp:Transcript_4377/g.8764  ORF Transcript_4377/g.8764 Transcript_4377/m.8764 type:complete len:233 (+) Transcript_4377:393-1091(+)
MQNTRVRSITSAPGKRWAITFWNITDHRLRHLWGHHRGCTTNCGHRASTYAFGNTKINEFHFALQCNLSTGHKNILGLQIPVNHMPVMHVLQPIKNLQKDVACQRLFQGTLQRNCFSQLLANDSFHDKKLVVWERGIGSTVAKNIRSAKHSSNVWVSANSAHKFEFLLDGFQLFLPGIIKGKAPSWYNFDCNMLVCGTSTTTIYSPLLSTSKDLIVKNLKLLPVACFEDPEL